jgi:hypothetical protein
MIDINDLEILQDFLHEKGKENLIEILSIKGLSQVLKSLEGLVGQFGKDLYQETFRKFFSECPEIKMITWEQYSLYNYDSDIIISEPRFWLSYVDTGADYFKNLSNSQGDLSKREHYLYQKMSCFTCTFTGYDPGDHITPQEDLFFHEEQIRGMVFGNNVRVYVNSHESPLYYIEDFRMEE